MPTRYLLYDAAESEGPSKQRMAGLYFLRRAMELDRVLVLPRCRLSPDTGSAHATTQQRFV